MQKGEQGNATLNVLLGVVLIIAVFCAVYFPYHSQQEKINKLNAQVSSLQTQLQTSSRQAGMMHSTPTQVPSDSSAYTSPKGVKVTVYAPVANTKVASPVAVVGQVPGSWSSEAQFPVVLKDSKGAVVSQGTAQVLGNWMMSSLVPFSAKLTYTGTPSGSGTLVLQKDNPSGLPANDDSVSIPVTF